MEKDKLEEEIKEEKKSLYFGRIILSIVTILLIITMIIPLYAIKLDPEPKNILSVEELGINFSLANQSHRISSRSDFLLFLEPENPVLKQVSARIASEACENPGSICYAKALFYFTRDKISYISDPVSEEYIESPEDTLYSRAADCDGKAVLLANMLRSIGINTRFAFTRNHVFVQAFMPEALRTYKEKGSDAINLDPACSSCKFGKLSSEVRQAEKAFI